ncbi:MAG: hypothetical protein AAB506_00210, partial [Patescibacteria group bacterium]
ALPLKLSPNFFVKSPQFWKIMSKSYFEGSGVWQTWVSSPDEVSKQFISGHPKLKGQGYRGKHRQWQRHILAKIATAINMQRKERSCRINS